MKFSVWKSATKGWENRQKIKPSQCKKNDIADFKDAFLFYGYTKPKKGKEKDDRDIPISRARYYQKALKKIDLSTK